MPPPSRRARHEGQYQQQQAVAAAAAAAAAAAGMGSLPFLAVGLGQTMRTTAMWKKRICRR